MERVTTLGTTNNAVAWMDAAQRRLRDRQQQVATGRRLEVASDSPGDTASLLRSQRSLDRLQQLARNTNDAQRWLDVGDAALTDTVDVLTRARTLAVQAANDTNTPDARAALAGDIRSLADQVLTLANTTVNGRAIFAGTAGTALAYAPDGTYLGDGGQVVRAVTPTDSFAVATGGPAAFGVVDPTDPFNGSAFQVLNAVADAVAAGDVAGMRQGIEAVDTAANRVQGEIGRLGNLASRVDEILSRNEHSQISARSAISEARDVDMGEAILRLRSAETSYEATMAATARGLSRSLLDFLR